MNDRCWKEDWIARLVEPVCLIFEVRVTRFLLLGALWLIDWSEKRSWRFYVLLISMWKWQEEANSLEKNEVFGFFEDQIAFWGLSGLYLIFIFRQKRVWVLRVIGRGLEGESTLNKLWKLRKIAFDVRLIRFDLLQCFIKRHYGSVEMQKDEGRRWGWWRMCVTVSVQGL